MSLRHAVVIATTGRRGYLLRRALESVLAQQHPPQRVVVVVDAAPPNADLEIASLRAAWPRCEVLGNRRTSGASGAWNSAIDHLLRAEHEPDQVIVSFLDDDDYWEPGYLGEVHAASTQTSAEVVGATLVRHDKTSPDGRSLLVDRLAASDFLIGNLGLQPTNLSIRLTTLAQAGCFDEALPSCTDRDLCIRLADLGAPYQVATNAIAHHDTLHGSARLSDPDNPKKHLGLDLFFAKYRNRMTDAERTAFAERSARLFGWTAQQDQPRPPITACGRVSPRPTNPIALVVGVIVDGSKPERAIPLVENLSQLAQHPAVERLDLVLLQNGSQEGFARVVRTAENAALTTWEIDSAAQGTAGRELGLTETELAATKTIAVARTLLQRFVHEVARSRPGAAAWILDDDVRLATPPEELVAAIHQARTRGLAAAIGNIVGAPPVPSNSTLRVQLVDLFHVLANAARACPDAPPPTPALNARWYAERRDYYYDLARSETDRLETPFVPEHSGATVADAVREIAQRAPRILAGELVTRQILLDPRTEWQPTHLRGGNTIVFDLDLLRDVPNLSPKLHGRRVRRSDMLWALHADRSGKAVARAPITVAQDRTTEPPAFGHPRKLVEDILGYAFFRAYEDIGSDDVQALRLRVRKLATERVAAYRLSFHRSRGLVHSIRRLVAEAPWWSQDPSVCTALDELLTGCDAALTDSRLDAVVDGVTSGVEQLEIEGFLAERDRLARPHAALLPSVTTWAQSRRESRARGLLGKAGFATDQLLGMGSEGVVLQIGERAFKVFDGWSRHDMAAHLDTLHSLTRSDCQAFPQVLAVHVIRGTAVLEYAYEASEPYRGGNGPALLSMLRALRESGWVHTNVHPKNLRVTAAGAVRLIDIGRSVIPYTENDEELMLRRAFLGWRFSFRSDLDELMRRSLSSDELVELIGWRSLLEGVRQGPAKARLDDRIAALVESSDARRVLDFGAGKPRHLHRLSRSWLAFEVATELRPRWATHAPWAQYLDEPALEAAITSGLKVDAVVCSLVLCTLGEAEAKRALARIRALLDVGGKAWIAVCDPTSACVSVTTDFERAASQVPYEANASYTKTIRASRMKRLEYHRSIAAYRRLFASAGLAVEGESTIDGVDAARFEQVSEFRVFQLRALGTQPCSASLLIKACGMDSSTARPCIEHLAGQLGRPRAFTEVVVVVDPRSDGFARKHHAGDLDRLRTELSRLCEVGVIDRVIEGPGDGPAARAIARDWFGLDTDTAHAENGQPSLAILAGIAACRSDLVFHADIDTLIARPNLQGDPISDAIAVFAAETEAAACSLPVFGDNSSVVRDHDERGPFRVDAVCGWVHRQRLLALRPLPNVLRDGRLALPWHRAVDRAVGAGAAHSLRKGASHTWFAHLDNARKADVDSHLLLLDRIEAGHVSTSQAGRPDVTGSLASWCGPQRGERVVVVTTGRDVSPGRIRRCIDSLRAQTYSEWGVVAVDDASDNGSADVLEDACRDLVGLCTLVKRRQRVGLLANLVLAVRHLASRPDAIIVTLDLDDALAPDALARIVREHDRGADLTVGSMVRTDKEAHYEVDFTNPRSHRGGNVWQHARSFRRSLFEQVERGDLQLDGRFVDLANDWAFMLPLVELAKHPVWLREPIYLHEPSSVRDNAYRQQREAIIGSVVRKPSYRNHILEPSLTVLAYHRVIDGDDPIGKLYRAHGMAVSPCSLEAHLRAASRQFEPVRLSDVARAFSDGASLPCKALLVTIDDGYADAADATAIALKLGFPVALFVRRPAEDGWPSWAPLDLLYHARASRGVVSIDAAERDEVLTWPLSDQLGHAAAGVMHDQAQAWRHALYLPGNRLRDLAGEDVELGSHGVDHVRWTNLDDEAIRAEVDRGFAWTDSFRHATRAIAYPDGAVDLRVGRVIEQAGATLGFAITHGADPIPPRFSIARLVPRDEPQWLERKIANLAVEP